MKIRGIVILVLFSAVLPTVSSSSKPKASYFIGGFGRKLSELRQHCLGVEQIQKEINKKVKVAELFDGHKLIKTLSSVIRRRFTERIEALHELKKGVEEDYARTPSGERLRCCKLNSTTIKYNSRFKTKVYPAHFCELRSQRSYEDARGLGDNVMQAMYQNLKKNHRLKWQYFGSAEGVTTIFPSSPAKTCGSYDNRVRPWYINTANPVRKDIVIVLDISTSMATPVTIETKTSTILDVAKEAVNSVLSTLLQEDQVGVVLFSSKTLLPGSNNTDTCYNERLASASAFNVNHLKTFINGAQCGGGTLYQRGFEAAFKLLKNAPGTGNPTRQSVILFITDGPPNDVKNTLIKSVKTIKAGLKVAIVTYGIGNNNKMKSFLKRLSKEAGTINNHVGDVADLSTELTSYYRHLHRAHDKKAYTVSPPYMDAWGLGVLITIAMPCARDGQFRGVAGIDITLPDLISEIQYFCQAGPDSYAFIAHQNGNVLSHPLMPPPETITKEPNLVHILSLEQGEGFEKLFEETKNSEERSVHDVMIVGQRRSMSRGGTIEDGIQEITTNSNYYCSKVLDYVTCVVLAENDVEMTIGDITDSKVAYHRMDLVQQGNICYYADSVSYGGKSVVQFNAKAFHTPSEYLDVNETPTNITSYLKYINHDKGPSMFQSGIARTAKISGFLDKLWIHTGRQEYFTQVPRRFFGTFNGVLRFFPGEPLPATYDHTNRHWYLRAKYQPNKLTFTTPYRDPLGAGIIVTVSHSITMPTKDSNVKTVFGVVAADLTISYLDVLIKNELGFRCKDTKTTTCFLIDTAGYVVFHPRFVQRNVYDDVAIVKSKHIAEIHGQIASRLIRNGLMKKRKCQNFPERRLQVFYKIDVAQQGIVYNTQENPRHCDTFAIIPVPKTNIFVVAAFSNSHSKCYDSAACHCKRSCLAATNDSFCECPCSQRLDFNYCGDTLKKTSIPSCTSPSSKIGTRPPLPPNAADLLKCFDSQCEEHVSEGSCRKTFGCSWCQWEETKDLDVPYCTYDNECYGGIRGRKNPFLRVLQTVQRNTTKTLNIPQKNTGNATQKATVVGGFIASLLLLIVISIGCYFFSKKKTPDEQPEVHDGCFNETEMHDGMYPQGYQEGYVFEGEEYNGQGYEGYDGSEAQGYPGEYLEQDQEQEYYLGEQLLPENEMFDDF